MNPSTLFANLSTRARCAVLSAVVLVICAFVVFGPQPQPRVQIAESHAVIFVVRDEHLFTWHRDPYVKIRWQQPVQIEPEWQILPQPEIAPVTPQPEQLVYVVMVESDARDPMNLVEDYRLVAMPEANRPRHLPFTHILEPGLWESVKAILPTEKRGQEALMVHVARAVELYRSQHTDISSFIYDSVTVKVNGAVEATIIADFPKPVIALPRGCQADPSDARYLILVDNNGASIERASDLFGHGPVRGKANSDLQLCLTRGWFGDAKWLMRQMARSYVSATGGTVRFDWSRTDYSLGSVRFIPPSR